MHCAYKPPGDTYVLDCVDLKDLAEQGYTALFNIVDWGSKFAWSFCLKRKTAETII